VTYALVAIANTLVMNVAGRRRELTALGLGGATRRQVVSVVVGEALLTAAVGSLVAIVAAGLEIGLQRLALSRVTDHPPLPVPWSSLWQIVALCAATAATAALGAAWRATARPTIATLTRDY
jgi:putative ABC transport system permease protein